MKRKPNLIVLKYSLFLVRLRKNSVRVTAFSLNLHIQETWFRFLPKHLLQKVVAYLKSYINELCKSYPIHFIRRAVQQGQLFVLIFLKIDLLQLINY